MTGFLEQFVYTFYNTHHTKVLIAEYLRPAPAGAAVLSDTTCSTKFSTCILNFTGYSTNPIETFHINSVVSGAFWKYLVHDTFLACMD